MKATAHEHRMRIEQLRPAMAHAYFFENMNRVQVAKKFNCSPSAVSTAVQMYEKKNINRLYGKDETIVVFPNKNIKEVLGMLKELNLPHRLPTEKFVLKEYYESKLSETATPSSGIEEGNEN